jgi:hypothetical protein
MWRLTGSLHKMSGKMPLPHEAEASAEIARTFGPELDAMTRLHEVVVGMMCVDSWTIGKRGLDPIVSDDHGFTFKSMQDIQSDTNPL